MTEIKERAKGKLEEGKEIAKDRASQAGDSSRGNSIQLFCENNIFKKDLKIGTKEKMHEGNACGRREGRAGKKERK